jgi:Flagellar hook-length control protein FliK
MSLPIAVSIQCSSAGSAKAVTPVKVGTKTEKNATGVDGFLSLLAAVEPDAEITTLGATQLTVIDPNRGDDKSDETSVLQDGTAVDLTFFLNQGKQWPDKENEKLLPDKSIEGAPTAAVMGQVTDRTQKPMMGSDAVASTITPFYADDGKGKKNVVPARILPQSDSGSSGTAASLSSVRSGASYELSQEAATLKAGTMSLVNHQSSRDEVVLVAAFSSLLDSKSSDRLQTRDALKPGGSGLEGIWGSGNPLSGNGATAYAAPAEAATVTAEAVAEQVTYWVNQELQNAELTLDGAGHDPIEVSISLQGNEANVAFRSDQAATREILEGAVSHLKEMLAHHGLSLAGVSVGNSGQDDRHPNKDRHPAEGRKATVRFNPQEMTAAGAITRTLGSNRVVDLFV